MHSLEERQKCCRLRTQGFPVIVVANALNVCKRTVQRWLNNKPTISRPLNWSHLRKLNETQREQVVDFFLYNNTSRLRDGVEFVRNPFDIYFSMSTIQRVLHESQLTLKKASTAYKEADLARQQEFLSTLSQHVSKPWIALHNAAFFPQSKLSRHPFADRCLHAFSKLAGNTNITWQNDFTMTGRKTTLVIFLLRAHWALRATHFSHSSISSLQQQWSLPASASANASRVTRTRRT